VAPTILLADTVTRLGGEHAGKVLVTGSHGGIIAAAYAVQARVRAAIFNDAGRGLDDAGVAGLAALDRIGVAACAVAHTSARIGDAADAFAHGVVSACNAAAAALGAAPGMRCESAATLLRGASWSTGALPFPPESRAVLAPASDGRRAVWGVDSIGLVEAADAGAVLVIGSHCALHGGDRATALPVAARAAFFHDAGRGPGDANVSRLPVLADRGIAAAAVDFRSARIGDARSLWETGVLSVVNAPAAARGVAPGMRVRDASVRLR
jgi:hypothetical protein